MNEALPHDCNRFCDAKTRRGTPCKRLPNHTGRCSKHGGKSLAGMAHPRFKHGLYSKYFPPFRVVELERKLPCTELKADSSPCRQWAMRDDPLRRCVAHRHGNARLEELAQRLTLPLRWVREQKENIIERIKLYQ